jgi:hypothetical protein
MPRYTVVDLGMTEGTASSGLVSVGINNLNQVVGQVFGSAGNEVVIRTYTTTPTTPPGPHNPATNLRYFSPDPINRSITPTAIDQSGQVVGYYTPSLVSQPFRLPAGTPTTGSVIDIPGPFPGTTNNGQRFDYAQAVSDNGQHIVGIGGGSGQQAWSRSPGSSGAIVTLPATGLTLPTASGVNNSGVIVGTARNTRPRAVRWDNATSEPTILPDLGGDFSRAFAINNSGYIVGDAYTPTGSFINHAVMWAPDGTITDLHAAVGLTSGTSTANDINSSNWVLVGGTSGNQRFLYIPGVGGASIQSLITSFGTMAMLGGVTGINDLGYISAHGTDSVGRSHLYILVPNNPIPTPTSAGAMMLLGLAGMRRRRGARSAG